MGSTFNEESDSEKSKGANGVVVAVPLLLSSISASFGSPGLEQDTYSQKDETSMMHPCKNRDAFFTRGNYYEKYFYRSFL
jgi:hypothetical protein